MDDPAVDSIPDDAADGGERMPRRRLFRRGWIWRVLRVLVALALIPVVLTFIYLLPFVHPVSTLMLKDLALLQGYDRRWVPIEQISPALIQSVIMSEDGQFCFHHGIDFGALHEVLDDAMDGGPTRGASTITMQTVKNLFLWSRPLSSVRKLFEFPMAVGFDAVVPKKRILEIYLNIAEWGPGIYGAEAAAQHHFKTAAKALSRRQAALLAVTLPNPYKRNPARAGPGLRRLAALIQRRANHSADYVRCVAD